MKTGRPNAFYYSNLEKLYAPFAGRGGKAAEIGTGPGPVLGGMKGRHDFFAADKITAKGKYGLIFLPDVFYHLYDIWGTALKLKAMSTQGAVLVASFTNPAWAPVLRLAEILHLKRREEARNKLSAEDISNLLALHDFVTEKREYCIIMPKNIPRVSWLLNRTVPKIPLIRRLCLLQYIAARRSSAKDVKLGLSCSVIIPCLNEEGNIKNAIARVPKMGRRTEIIVVDDGSTDRTAAIVRGLMKKNRNLKLISYRPNRGKGFAVKSGFAAATGDVLMIMDADMTVMPEELPNFFLVLEEGKADFVNGTRLIYPPEKQAMKSLHAFGNYMFGKIFSWLLGYRITDTLCGTKVLFKKDFGRIEMGKCKWGDFDLLFGASKLGLRIVEMPVHYKKRVAGESKMKTFKHGYMLFKMCFRGLVELKLKRN
jgi:hypothetical protein